MEGATGEAEDPFAEFLSQEPNPAPQEYADPGVAPTQGGAEAQLAQLVAVAQRQEQLLGQVCGLLTGLDERVSQLTRTQERLEATMQRVLEQGTGSFGGGAPAGTGSFGAGGGATPQARPSRGSLIAPPGHAGNFNPTHPPQATPVGGGPSAAEKQEEQRRRFEEDQARLRQEQIRNEEEARRRAEELARRREEEERRQRDEAERRRLEEERRAEEERKRKAALEARTSGLMAGLMEGSGQGGLFDDDAPKKRTSKGLFDD